MANALLSILGAPVRRIIGFWKAQERRIENRRLFKHIVKLAAREGALEPPGAPFVSLVVPVYNAPPGYLDTLVASVRSQVAGAWELILCDDGSSAPQTRRWLDAHAADSDLKILRSEENRGGVAASNAAIVAASAPWIAFLDHDDALAPFALDRVWRALQAAPDCQFLYTDEVIADRRMQPVELFLKPAFDPVLLSGVNYLNHLSLYRRQRVLELSGLREGFEGSQDYDLALRYTKGLKSEQCLRLPYPAYIRRRDWRRFSSNFTDRATDNARRALSEAYQSGEKPPVVVAAPGNLHRVRFDADRDDWPLVSAIIPSRDSYPLIRRVLAGLCEETDYPNLEIIVIDNGTTDKYTLELYQSRRSGSTPFHAIIEPEAFNFARAINKGVARARGDFLLLINNDIEVLHPDWLKEMVECFAYGDIGVVGAKLLYPDGTHQHAGVIVGFGGLAGHWYLNTPSDFPGPMGRLWVRQSLTCVTGACFLVSKACFAKVGPFDEALFAIAYNDVDFCLRARQAGFRIVWTPFAKLAHHESASRGSDETEANRPRFLREQENLRRRHATDAYQDFAISPWFTKDRTLPIPMRLDRLPPAQ